MPLELTKEELAQVLPSLQRYFREELEQDLSEMRARGLLEFMMKEIAPLAYNRGVRDAEKFTQERLIDMADVCFEQPGTYWDKPKKKK